MKKNIKAWFEKPENRLLVAFAVITVVVGLTRLVPYPLRPINFAPIGALGLFAGTYAKTKWSWAFPIGALLIADITVGFYNPPVLVTVYLGFALSGLIGRKFLAKKSTAPRIGLSAVGSGTVFFVVSNFGIWLAGYYPRNWVGLVECYTMAVPLYRNTLAGDLFFSFVLFGAFALASTKIRNGRWLGQTV